MINQETGLINFNEINAINVELERTFLYKFLLVVIVTIPATCPLCNHNSIGTCNNESLNNQW